MLSQESSETSSDYGELVGRKAGGHESHNKSKIKLCTRERTGDAEIVEQGARSKPAAGGRRKSLALEPGRAGRLQNSLKPVATPGEGLVTSATLIIQIHT